MDLLMLYMQPNFFYISIYLILSSPNFLVF